MCWMSHRAVQGFRASSKALDYQINVQRSKEGVNSTRLKRVCRAFEKTLSWPSQWFWEEARLIAQLWHWKLFCEMKNDSGKEEAKVLIYRFSEGILEVSLCCFCHETEKYCLHTFTLMWMQLMSFIWFLEWKSVPVTSRDTLKLNSNVCRAKNCLLQLWQTSGNKCWVLFACYHDDLRHFNS